MTVGDANASDRRGLGGRGVSAVEVATAAPAAAAGRTLAPWPDANRVAHESIRDQTNMIGNSVAAIVVAKWEGQLDVEQARRVLNPPKAPAVTPDERPLPEPIAA